VNTSLRERIPAPVLELARTLDREGERTWIVGGCIRDLLLGRTVSDWDLATSAKPQRVQKIFPRTIPTGIAHGTVTVMHRGIAYEVTTLRGEGAYSDGRRPDSVYFVDDIRDDLERRDFTVNAIAYDPNADVLVDPFEGRKDLDERVLRAVRDPVLRFREDGLRILRATRFVATLELALDRATEDAIPGALDVLAKVSRERMRDEWMKTMKAREPSIGFRLMRRLGVLGVVAPALAKTDEDAFERALVALDRASDPLVRHAALASSLGVGEDAARASESVFRELRYSNDERRTISDLLRFADVADRRTLGRPQARRHLRRVGRERIDGFLEFERARDDSVDGEATQAWARSVNEERDAGMIFEARELAMRGDEVADRVGRGPIVKETLERLLAYVDEDPSNNRHDLLLARIDAARGAPT